MWIDFYFPTLQGNQEWCTGDSFTDMQMVTAGGHSTGKHANKHNKGQNCSVNVTKTRRNAS